MLTFVRADILAFQPRHEATDLDYGEAGSSGGFGVDTPAEPRFPKSLFLVKPLFSAYELGPVAVHAQASVPVPEGLDLNAWIVPPPADEAAHNGSDADETIAIHKAKKSKKGKAKDLDGAKTKRKKRREGEELQEDALTPTVIETEDEKAERERVSVLHALVYLVSAVFDVVFQRKAERLERLRDDPFYLADDRPATKPKVADLDSIPVVRLDDLPPLPQSSGE